MKKKQIRKFMTTKKLEISQKLRKQIRQKQFEISKLETKRDYLINKLVRVLIGNK